MYLIGYSYANIFLLAQEDTVGNRSELVIPCVSHPSGG